MIKFYVVASYEAQRCEFMRLREKNGYRYVPGTTAKDARRLDEINDMKHVGKMASDSRRDEPLELVEPFRMENGIVMPIGTTITIVQAGVAPENGSKSIYAKPPESAMVQGTESDKPKHERSAQVRVLGFSWWNFEQPV